MDSDDELAKFSKKVCDHPAIAPGGDAPEALVVVGAGATVVGVGATVVGVVVGGSTVVGVTVVGVAASPVVVEVRESLPVVDVPDFDELLPATVVVEDPPLTALVFPDPEPLAPYP